MSLKDKKILLGVCGSIACYKSISLASQLTQNGAEVRVILTKSAQEFVKPLVFQSISHQEVYTDVYEERDPSVITHIYLAQWADLVIVAPGSANILGKLANGIADDLLTTTWLAIPQSTPKCIALGMNSVMYEHVAVQRNIATLISDGVNFLEGESGYLACGVIGKGRMQEPEDIYKYIVEYFTSTNNGVDDASSVLINTPSTNGTDITDSVVNNMNENITHDVPSDLMTDNLPLLHRNVLLTVGPTVEHIDPVRYITNKSSGKMGYALATAALKLGANVTIVSGPVDKDLKIELKSFHKSFQADLIQRLDIDKATVGKLVIIDVESAKDMFEEVKDCFDSADITIGTAAVADFTVANKATSKIKKTDGDDTITLTLVKNPDIIEYCGSMKMGDQIVVGFAAETDSILKNGEEKLYRKNTDFIVVNDVGNSAIGFNSNDNKVDLLYRINRFPNINISYSNVSIQHQQCNGISFINIPQNSKSVLGDILMLLFTKALNIVTVQSK